MNINYRLAEEADLVILSELRWKFRTEEESVPESMNRNTFVKACREFLYEGLLSKQWVYWIAESQSEIIAHIFIQRIKKVPKPQRLYDSYGYITNVYTKPAYRGQGVGYELLTKAKAWAKHQDLEILIVWPSEESINFYKKLGFKSQNDVMEYELRPD